jgi:hypothetical protein
LKRSRRRRSRRRRRRGRRKRRVRKIQRKHLQCPVKKRLGGAQIRS